MSDDLQKKINSNKICPYLIANPGTRLHIILRHLVTYREGFVAVLLSNRKGSGMIISSVTNKSAYVELLRSVCFIGIRWPTCRWGNVNIFRVSHLIKQSTSAIRDYGGATATNFNFLMILILFLILSRWRSVTYEQELCFLS